MHDVLAAAHMGGIETQLKYRVCFSRRNSPRHGIFSNEAPS